MGATTTSIRHLYRLCTGRCRSRSRGRIVDDESVELLGHHRGMCAQPPSGSAGGIPGAKLHFLILKLIKQALNQISVYFDDLVPATDILNANLYFLRSCATVSQRQMP